MGVYRVIGKDKNLVVYFFLGLKIIGKMRLLRWY